MSKTMRRRSSESGTPRVADLARTAKVPTGSRRVQSRELPSEFSEFGREGGDSELGVMLDLLRRASDE
jgi:hypothetical protein